MKIVLDDPWSPWSFLFTALPVNGVYMPQELIEDVRSWSDEEIRIFLDRD